MSNGLRCIPIAEYEQLKRDQEKLHALEAAGVDNWEGYAEAMQDIEEDDDEV